MKPKYPSADEYDDHYQIEPHFQPTPGLTEIPKSSPNYNINLRLKPKLAALYRKHSLVRCPNYGLFWIGYPEWTMIRDRDRMVVLVMEMTPSQIADWRKLDAEVRQFRDQFKLTGVTIRYYEYRPERKLEAREALQRAEQIHQREALQAAERDAAIQSHTPNTVSEIEGLGAANVLPHPSPEPARASIRRS